jgi:fatty-acyl-CoA synthase
MMTSSSTARSAVTGTTRRHTLADLLRRSAARTPGRTALVFGERRHSYAELDADVDRAALALTARGIRAGERVALLSRNNDDFVVLYFALARIGAVSVPVNFMLGPDEVGYLLGHSGARWVVAQPDLLATAEQAVKAGGLSVETASLDEFRAWLQEQPLGVRPPEPAIDDESPAQIVYTSGTESRPKGATLSHRSLIAQYASCVADGEMRSDDVELHALPLYHCAQLHCFLTPGIQLGATNVVLPGPDPAELLRLVEAERATKLFCPPTVWISLLRHPDLDRRDLSSLRKGYYGASIMPVEVLRELAARLPDVRLFNFYGQTEMGPLATVLGPDDQFRKPGSAGRAALNVETRVVDEDDRPLPPGEVGEIVHRSPHAMLGYWDDPEQSARVFRNGWFHSGDLGVLDDEGYLTVVDRKKDMIKTGGENVSSREVEEVLYQHPGVAEAAVFALPDPQWIESVTAAVVPREGQRPSEAELIAFCRQRLAGFKTPKRVVTVAALPKNASGKILKRELRERFAQ